MTAAEFNSLYEVGVPVIAYPACRPEDCPNDKRLVTRTRSLAQVLGGHTDVVWVDGHDACIALDHIDVIGEADFKALQLADAVAQQGALPMPVGPVASRLSPQREAEIVAGRYTDRSLAAADVAIDDLLTELTAVRKGRDEARLELSEYEQLNPQQCQAEKHPDWLIDSEYAHACPWCEIELLKQNRAADAIEYGIRIPDGTVLLDGSTNDRRDQEDRLVRYRDTWPEARLVQRVVFHGEWTEATS